MSARNFTLLIFSCIYTRAVLFYGSKFFISTISVACSVQENENKVKLGTFTKTEMGPIDSCASIYIKPQLSANNAFDGLHNKIIGTKMPIIAEREAYVPRNCTEPDDPDEGIRSLRKTRSDDNNNKHFINRTRVNWIELMRCTSSNGIHKHMRCELDVSHEFSFAVCVVCVCVCVCNNRITKE